MARDFTKWEELQEWFLDEVKQGWDDYQRYDKKLMEEALKLVSEETFKAHMKQLTLGAYYSRIADAYSDYQTATSGHAPPNFDPRALRDGGMPS